MAEVKKVGFKKRFETFPGVFRLNEDGVAEVYDPEGASEEEI